MSQLATDFGPASSTIGGTTNSGTGRGHLLSLTMGNFSLVEVVAIAASVATVVGVGVSIIHWLAGRNDRKEDKAAAKQQSAIEGSHANLKTALDSNRNESIQEVASSVQGLHPVVLDIAPDIGQELRLPGSSTQSVTCYVIARVKNRGSTAAYIRNAYIINDRGTKVPACWATPTEPLMKLREFSEDRPLEFTLGKDEACTLYFAERIRENESWFIRAPRDYLHSHWQSLARPGKVVVEFLHGTQASIVNDKLETFAQQVVRPLFKSQNYISQETGELIHHKPDGGKSYLNNGGINPTVSS